MGFMCQIYEGRIKDAQTESLSTYFYDQPTTDKRRNRYIYPTVAGSLKIVNMVELFARTGFEAFASVEGRALAFVYPRECP
jgi:UDP-glucose:glycoprotein glucosyltransferase